MDHLKVKNLAEHILEGIPNSVFSGEEVLAALKLLYVTISSTASNAEPFEEREAS